MAVVSIKTKPLDVPDTSGRLADLLDKLVAVRMDLSPACRGIVVGIPPRVSPTLETIAADCDILRSAIADIRNIIGQLDGMNDPPGSLPAAG